MQKIEEIESFDVVIGPAQNGRGGQTLSITDSKNDPIILQLGSTDHPLRSPFGAGVYGDQAAQDKATRLNLDLTVHDHPLLLNKLRELDSAIFSSLQSSDLKIKSLDDAYRPIVIEDAKYGTQRIRCKLQLTGMHATKCWHTDHSRIDDPKSIDFRECPCVPVVQVKNVWVMQKDMGVVLELKHVVVTKEVSSFPLV